MLGRELLSQELKGLWAHVLLVPEHLAPKLSKHAPERELVRKRPSGIQISLPGGGAGYDRSRHARDRPQQQALSRRKELINIVAGKADGCSR
jgi:hypothetical protein